MRSLNDWHKYLDIQEKRVSSAKSGQPTLPALDQPETEAEEIQGTENVGQGALLDDLYADGVYTASSYLSEPVDASTRIVDEPLPEHLKPTPLPAMIEYAPDDLLHRSERDAGELTQARVEPAAPAYTVPVEPAREEIEELSEDERAFSIADEPGDAPRLARNGRSASGAARKETREELLARLLDPELTLEEAAQVLNVCPTTVRRYTNRGVLPHYRTIGNQRRFRLSQVLAFLETQEAMPRSQVLGSGHENGVHAQRPIQTVEEP